MSIDCNKAKALGKSPGSFSSAIILKKVLWLAAHMWQLACVMVHTYSSLVSSSHTVRENNVTNGSKCRNQIRGNHGLITQYWVFNTDRNHSDDYGSNNTGECLKISELVHSSRKKIRHLHASEIHDIFPRVRGIDRKNDKPNDTTPNTS